MRTIAYRKLTTGEAFMRISADNEITEVWKGQDPNIKKWISIEISDTYVSCPKFLKMVHSTEKEFYQAFDEVVASIRETGKQ